MKFEAIGLELQCYSLALELIDGSTVSAFAAQKFSLSRQIDKA